VHGERERLICRASEQILLVDTDEGVSSAMNETAAETE